MLSQADQGHPKWSGVPASCVQAHPPSSSAGVLSIFRLMSTHPSVSNLRIRLFPIMPATDFLLAFFFCAYLTLHCVHMVPGTRMPEVIRALLVLCPVHTLPCIEHCKSMYMCSAPLSCFVVGAG